jgi:spore coat protein U-like protein
MFAKSKAATFKLALLASIVAAAAGMIAPSHAATATATATATVVTPITIAKASDLAFGKFASGATIGTVVVDTAGGVNRTGGVSSGGGTVTAAAFTVTGDKGAAYSIDTSATTANLTSGTDTMALALITDVSTGAGATSGTVASGLLDGTTGIQTVRVGGSLAVGINQPAGSYTGTVSVAVLYQ